MAIGRIHSHPQQMRPEVRGFVEPSSAGSRGPDIQALPDRAVAAVHVEPREVEVAYADLMRGYDLDGVAW
jgi:hypothetical protein